MSTRRFCTYFLTLVLLATQVNARPAHQSMPKKPHAVKPAIVKPAVVKPIIINPVIKLGVAYQEMRQTAGLKAKGQIHVR